MNKAIHAIALAASLLAVPLALGLPDPIDEVCAELPPDACAFPSLDSGLGGVIGDETVESGEEQRYENGTYVATGEVEVEEGGRLVFDNATIVFSSASDGVVVRNGGDIQILTSGFGPEEGQQRAESLIRVESGATGRVVDSTFRGFTLHLASSNLAVEDNIFTQSPLALHLEAVSLTLKDLDFRDNAASMLVVGGSPQILSSAFERGGLEIDVRDASNVLIDACNFLDSDNGIHLQRSTAIVQFGDVDDRGDPPGAGIVVEDAPGEVLLRGNFIHEWGTGIKLRNNNGNVVLDGNTFANNIVDIDSDEPVTST